MKRKMLLLIAIAYSKKNIYTLQHIINKLLNGYAFAAQTMDNLLLHKDIKHFKDLPASEKQLDEAIVDNIHRALCQHGYVLQRLTNAKTNES